MAKIKSSAVSRYKCSANASRLMPKNQLVHLVLFLLAGVLILFSNEQVKAQNNNSNTIQVQPLPQIGQPQPVQKRPKQILRKPTDQPPVIGVLSGPHGSATLQMTSELSQIVSPDLKFRIVPLVGDSQLQNLNDLFWLVGVDLAVIQRDTLNWAKTSKKFKPLISRLRYITEFSSSEIHILADSEIRNIRELEGKKVNFGVNNTQSTVTAKRIFEAMEIEVEPVYLGLQAAIQKIRKKTLAATIFISGKPAPGLAHLRRSEGLKLLDIDYTEELSPEFTPEIISHEDYPNLITDQEAVSTIAVRSVLMVYNWKTTNPRYQKVSKFVDILFSNLDNLSSDAYHPKWRDISLTFKIEGWTRFKSAQEWLKRNRPSYSYASASAKLKATFEGFLQSQGTDSANTLTKQERELLFNKFVSWRNRSTASEKSN